MIDFLPEIVNQLRNESSANRFLAVNILNNSKHVLHLLSQNEFTHCIMELIYRRRDECWQKIAPHVLSTLKVLANSGYCSHAMVSGLVDELGHSTEDSRAAALLASLVENPDLLAPCLVDIQHRLSDKTGEVKESLLNLLEKIAQKRPELLLEVLSPNMDLTAKSLFYLAQKAPEQLTDDYLIRLKNLAKKDLVAADTVAILLGSGSHKRSVLQNYVDDRSLYSTRRNLREMVEATQELTEAQKLVKKELALFDRHYKVLEKITLRLLNKAQKKHHYRDAANAGVALLYRLDIEKERYFNASTFGNYENFRKECFSAIDEAKKHFIHHRGLGRRISRILDSFQRILMLPIKNWFKEKPPQLYSGRFEAMFFTRSMKKLCTLEKSLKHYTPRETCMQPDVALGTVAIR